MKEIVQSYLLFDTTFEIAIEKVEKSVLENPTFWREGKKAPPLVRYLRVPLAKDPKISEPTLFVQ